MGRTTQHKRNNHYITEIYPRLKSTARLTLKKIEEQSKMSFLDDTSIPKGWLDLVWIEGNIEFNNPIVPTKKNGGYSKSASKTKKDKLKNGRK